jgi:hypothetical protein
MAALALIAGTSIAVGRGMPNPAPSAKATSTQQNVAGQEETQAEAQTPTALTKPAGTRVQLAHLNLAIAGLGRQGCEVEVKPGNASCKFRVVNVTKEGVVFKKGAEGPQHVSSDGYAYVDLRDIELRGADRACTVAITVREPGQPPKTIYRGFRLASRAEGGAPSTSATVPSFTCYLSSPSKLAKSDTSKIRK